MNRPEGWESVSLETVCVLGGLVRGPFGGSLKKSDFVPVGLQVYEQRNAIQGTLDARYFVTPAKFAEMSRFAVADGDFIVSCSGTIGRIFQIPPNAAPGIINQALLKIRIDPAWVDPHFFRLYFQWEEFQDLILDSTQGGAMKNLVGMPVFRRSPILVPPIEEQRLISTAVLDVDSEVLFLERLIAKKQAIKQGMMQQLLTGKTRVSGYTGGWTKATYREIVTIQRGEVFVARDERAGGPIPVIAAGQGPAAFTYRANRQGPVVTISASGASAGYVAFHRAAIFASDCSTISPSKGFDLRFIYYGLKLQQDRIYQAQAGGAQPHIHAKDVYPLEVAVPPSVDEQRAIAGVLGDIDDEIDALIKRMAKARQVKQGMMQELLTGRTRLVPEAHGVPA